MSETLDEVTILELLDIHADELLDAFPEKIEERYNYLIAQLELETKSEEDNNSYEE